MHNQSKELWLSGGLGLCGQSTKVRNKPENEPDIDIWNINVCLEIRKPIFFVNDSHFLKNKLTMNLRPSSNYEHGVDWP